MIYFPNRIVSWNNPQHLVKFQDRMVNPVHYMKFLKRFVFVSNDYETDVYVNHKQSRHHLGNCKSMSSTA